MDTGRTVTGATMSEGASTLRRATAADAPEVRSLVRAAYDHYVARLGREPQPMTADYDHAVREHQIWVLDGSEGLRAVLELKPCDDGSLSIENIAVSPAHQKSGLGRRLMAFAETEALRQGFARTTLYTNEKMTENIALYTRLGYVETERRTVGDHRRVFMSKDLGGNRVREENRDGTRHAVAGDRTKVLDQ